MSDIWIRLLSSEYMLSLYPALVHHIEQPIHIQMWGRFLVFSILGFVFGSGIKTFNTLFDPTILTLSLVNIAHIYTSYLGFRNLKPANAYSIFYLYPFTNLILLYLLGQQDIRPLQWLAFALTVIGVTLINVNSYYSLAMGVSAITESVIYVIIKSLNLVNSWDGVFYAYTWPAIGLSLLYFKDWFHLGIPILINGVIGAIGYYLRFWNAKTVSPISFSLASYFGIPFSYINQYFINGFKPDKLLGTSLVLFGLLLSLFFRKSNN